MSTTVHTTTVADLLDGAADNELRTLADWASILPGRRRGRSMNARVPLRWVIKGIRGRRLPTRRCGQRHLCLGRDLREFLAAIAPGADRAAPRPSQRALSRRRERRAAVAARLAKEALL